MKIIRGHDFYDSAMGYGVDNSIIFVRSHEQYSSSGLHGLNKIPSDFPFRLPTVYVDFKDNAIKYSEERLQGKSLRGINIVTEVYPVVIFFAGKIYYGAMKDFCGMLDFNSNYMYDDISWSLRDFASLFENIRKGYTRYGIFFTSRAQYLKHTDDISPMESYFEAKTPTKVQLDWVIANKISIFVYYCGNRENNLIINPANLRVFEFYRRLEAFQAYQELSMWVGGILPQDGKEMVSISDKDKIHKHGFDSMSFKKEPWKKNRKS